MKDHAASALSLVLALSVLLITMVRLRSQVAAVGYELETARHAMSGLHQRVQVMQQQRVHK